MLGPTWCGAAGLDMEGEFRVGTPVLPLLTDLGQRFNFSWAQFTSVSVGWAQPACLSGSSVSQSEMLSSGETRFDGVLADRVDLEPP